MKTLQQIEKAVVQGESTLTSSILISDLASSAIPNEHVSSKRSRKHWQAIRYETAGVQGTMLLAGQETSPSPVTITLRLKGWHRIYVCLAHIGGLMYTYLKLTGDRCSHGVIPGRMNTLGWSPTEHVEESFWRCADLTGKNLILSKPVSCEPSSSALVWVRCVPMSDGDVAAYETDESRTDTRILHAHFDTDFIGNDALAGVDDYLVKLQSLRGSDVKICSQEVCFDQSGYYDDEPADDVGYKVSSRIRTERARKFHPIRGEVYRTMVDYAHETGILLYAAQRMNIASFDFPFGSPHYRVRFCDEHPEYAIVTRDGRRIAEPSYAYPEVQDYAIQTLLDAYQYGFDGVTLIWTRGIHIGFEQPVVDRVLENHPGIAPCTLPASDERLHCVWCEIFTIFMRKLRAALDDAAKKAARPSPGINVDVFCDIRLGKHAGLDVENWVKEGLVTGVIQDNMVHFENLTDCMSDDNPALIDMDKYRLQLGQRVILRRRHGNEVAANLMAIAPFAALRQHGVDVFHAMPWEHSVPPAEFLRLAKDMYANDASGLHLWDCNGRVRYLPEWNVQRKLGHRDELDRFGNEESAYRTVHRVLRWNDLDISYASPNWRG